MKPIPDCVPDALAMIIATARAVSDDDFIHEKVLLKVMGALAEEGELDTHPADIYLQSWEIACRALGVRDPYENEKARSDKTALGVLRYLQELNPPLDGESLYLGLRIALAANMLDFTGLGRGDIQERIVDLLHETPAHDDTQALISAIEKTSSVMLVASRAGEIVLDRPLVEALVSRGKKVYLAVAAKPVFVMATEKDVETAALPEEVKVVNPGTAMYGLVPERASSEFRSLLAEAGVVIVKGATHFATMTAGRDLFFILRAREPEIATRLDIPLNAGAIVMIPASGDK